MTEKISNHEKKKFMVNNKQILTKQLSIQIGRIIRDRFENTNVFTNPTKKGKYIYADLNIIEDEDESLLDEIYVLMTKQIDMLKNETN